MSVGNTPIATPADLAERIRRAHAKAMEALAADVHPYSGPAIREWEADLDDALAQLLRRAEDPFGRGEMRKATDW